MRFAIAVAVAAFASTLPAFAQGDAVAGKAVFAKCGACHAADKPQNRVGPSLMGVIGRHAASVADYTYSNAMTKAGGDGVVWDEMTLAVYLVSPKAMVPGTKMTFPGLKSDTDIANVIAYLKTFPAP